MAKSNPKGNPATTTKKVLAQKATKPAAKKKSTAGSSSANTAAMASDSPLKNQILTELGKYAFLKKYSAKAIQVAKACGFSSTETKRFRNARKELKNEGKITSKGDMMELTAESIADQLNKKSNANAAAPKSNKEHQDAIKKLFASEKNHGNLCKLIDLLADGGSLTPMDAAKAMGYAAPDSKGYRNAKSLLKDGGFLEGTKEISLTEEMFPFGRPDN
jgi:hypothetical protein